MTNLSGANKMNLFRQISCTVLVFSLCVTTHLSGHDENGPKGIGSSAPPGIGGDGPYNFHNVRMSSRLSIADLGGGQANVIGNDIWGWTDSQTGKEYALFGLTNATSFVDISDPTAPVYLGRMMTHTGNAAWRDIKVYNNHAYVVSDVNGAHGMQIFDLTRLRDTVPEPIIFSPDAHYSGFNNAHNLAINEDTGFAYVVGTNTASGGLHVLDLSNPTAPVHVGNFSADGYTHDTQVVTYHGPDASYAGREIAFNSNEDTLTIVDVTDKNNLNSGQISRTGYPGSRYAHQGWLSEDHRFFFMNDELDERNDGSVLKTITRVWDVSDLSSPVLLNEHEGTEYTIDHNNYVHNGLIFQANYTSGMRVLKLIDESTGELEEVAFFDTYNSNNNISFNGAWSVFPYFDSGSVIVSDRQNGLFVLRLVNVPEPSSFAVCLVMFAGFSVTRRRKRHM